MIAPTESAPVGEVLGGAFLSPETNTSGRWGGRVPQPAFSLPDDARFHTDKARRDGARVPQMELFSCP